jgi:alanine dehydrogenase
MLVGVPREVKDNEFRVGLTPSAIRELVAHGHRVVVESGAGSAIDLDDDRYQAAGAEIVEEAAEVFGRAEMVVKVKEPQPSEIAMLRDGQVLFTYLHLAPDLAQTRALLKAGCVAVAYETVTDERGGLPLLAPMSEVAGCRSRPEPMPWRKRPVVGECCWAACRACRLPGWSCWVAAWWA